MHFCLCSACLSYAGDPLTQLRVLTLIDKPTALGGAERMACEIAMGLDPDRFERWFCATRRAPTRLLDDELRQAGVRYVSLNRTRRFDLRAWWKLLRLLRKERIDVVHAHLFGSNAAGSVLGRLARVPVVIAHEHTWSFEGAPLRKVVDRQVVGRLADRIIAVSEADRRKMIEIERIPSDRISVIPNGIPPLRHDDADIRQELGIPADAPVVGVVAVVRPQKRLDRLVRAAALLRTEFPSLRVLVAGDGSPAEFHRVRALIEELGVGDVVVMLGERSDVSAILRALDVGVLSSDFEGLPLAVIEYMAAGVPVVATAVGGLPELVDDGETGLLVRDLSPEGLAAAIATLLRDRVLARRLGERGREVQQERFSLAATVENVSRLYEELYEVSRRR